MIFKKHNTWMNGEQIPNTRLVFLRHILFLIIGILFLFTLFNFYKHRYALAIVELIMLLSSIFLLIKFESVFSSKFTNIFAALYTIIIMVAWLVTVLLQPITEMVYFWYFAILMACYALNGAKTGFKITLLFLIFTASACYYKSVTSSFSISIVTWLNTLIPSLSIWYITHVYEKNNNRVANELSMLATHDTLTGLKDRHQIYSVYRGHPNQMHSLILLDIAQLSQVNEKHGYMTGDLVLINIANILKQSNISDVGEAFRTDGDEFAILFPNLDCKATTNIATMLRQEIEEYKTILKYDAVQVNVSMGIACITSDGYNFDELLQKASSILRHAKATSSEHRIPASC